MSTLFISYSTKDRATADIVYKQLIDMGYEKPFRDDHPDSGIPAGSDWEQELYRKLRLCKALIVLCSKNWMDSKWCFAELAYAKAMGKEFFPIRIDDANNVPSVVAERQAINLEDENVWQRLRKGLEDAKLAPHDDFFWDITECPYPGLEPFTENHAGVYFGRDEEIQELRETLNRMRSVGQPRLLYVVGASGSGKSSLVRAGLLPRLKTKETGQWCLFRTFRWNDLRVSGRTWAEQLAVDLCDAWPLDDPKKPEWSVLRERYSISGENAAAAAADRFIDDTKNLLVSLKRSSSTPLFILDQFEEVLVSTEGEPTGPFLDFLGRVMSSPRSPWRCVATVRSDFLNTIQTRPELIAWKQHTDVYSLPLMNPERFYDVIRRPAEKVGITFEPETLVDQIVKDTGDNDALPLLAFTLRELYEQYGDDKRFTFDEYANKLGRLEGCLKQVADKLLAVQLELTDSKDAQRALQLTFSNHLVDINEQDKFVRRTAVWSEIKPAAQPILRTFIARRLLTSRLRDEKNPQSEQVVEVAHEALFRKWDRLKDWLDARRDLLRWRRDVRRDHLTDGERWSGLTRSQLAVARDWPTRRHDELFPQEIEWIKSAKRRIGFFWAGIGTVAVTILGIAAIAWSSSLDAKVKKQEADLAIKQKEFAEKREKTERTAKEAETKRAEEEEERSKHFTRMVYYFRAAEQRQKGEYDQARKHLEELDAFDAIDGRFSLFRKLAWWDYYRTAPPPVSSLYGNLSDNDDFVLVGDSLNPLWLTVDIDEHTVTAVGLFSGKSARQFRGHSSKITAVQSLRDGNHFATADLGGRILLWDVSSDSIQREFQIPKHKDKPLRGVWPIALTDCDEPPLLAAADRSGDLHLWDKNTGEYLESGADLHRKALLPEVPELLHGTFDRITLNGNGTILAAGHDDGNVSLWSVRPLKLLTEAKEHNSKILALVFEGESLVTKDNDGGLFVWKTKNAAELTPDARANAGVTIQSSYILSRSETRLAPTKIESFPTRKSELPASDQLLRLVKPELATSWRFGSLTRHSIDSELVGAHTTPDGRMTVTVRKVIPEWMKTSWKYVLEDFKTTTLLKETLRQILDRPKDVQAIVRPHEWLDNLINDERAIDLEDAVSKLVARADQFDRGSVIVDVWMNDNRALRLIPPTPRVHALSRDGRLAFLADYEPNLISVYDVATERNVAALAGHRVRISSLAISPDGSHLASGCDAGDVIQWDIASGKQLTRLSHPNASVNCIAFAPSGNMLAIGFSDGELNVLATKDFREVIAEKFVGHSITSLVFSTNESGLVLGSSSGSVGFRSLENGQATSFVDAHEDPVRAISASAGESRVLAVSAGEDGSIISWNIQQWPDHKEFPPSHGEVTALVASEDFRSLLSFGWSNQAGSEVNLWDAQLGLVLAGYGFHEGRIDRLATSGDGLTIWSVSSGLSKSESKLADLRIASEYRRFEPMFWKDQQPLSSSAMSPEVLGEWLAFRGRSKQAIEQGELARVNGGLNFPSIWLAQSYLREGDEAKAEAELRSDGVDKWDQHQQLYAKAWLSRWNRLRHLKQLETQPETAKLLVERAQLRFELADLAAAITDLNRAVELEPQNASVRIARARGFESFGRSTDADDDYRRALDDWTEAARIDPSFVPALTYRHSYELRDRAEERFKARDLVNALADFDAALKFQPDHFGCLGRRSNIYAAIAKSKDRKREASEVIRLFNLAISDNERIIKINPQSGGRALKGGGIMVNNVTPGIVGMAYYNIACYQTLLSALRNDAATQLDDINKAATSLRKAIDNDFAKTFEHSTFKGLSVRQAIEQDDDLRLLRTNPEYQKLLSELK